MKTINNNTGYSQGNTMNIQEETAWAHFEDQSPYKRLKNTSNKTHFSDMFDGDVFGNFAFITIIVIIISTIVAYELDKEGNVRWIWTNYFWNSLFDSIKTALVIGGLLFAILTLIYVIIKYPKYRKYFVEARKDNILIKHNNEENYKRRLVVAKKLQQEYDYITQKIIKQTEQNRIDIYSLGVIDKDYQNIVAISSFYQYFRTGRVDSLTGTFGAYNKYEEERRQDVIITELRKIVSSLEQIKENQRALYDATKEGQNVGNRIIQEVHKMQEQNNILIDNSYVTKYNAQNIANNTEFLKWYAFIKN